jgi:hypothetical protein
MKLYTEEQVRKAYDMGLLDGRLNNTDYSITDGFKPIELPSDEEIVNKWDNEIDEIPYIDGAINGAKWMKEQILNQNK